MAKLTVRVYADDVLLRETEDERVAAAVMSFIADPLPSYKQPYNTEAEKAFRSASDLSDLNYRPRQDDTSKTTEDK